jgi:hypothetical protein
MTTLAWNSVEVLRKHILFWKNFGISNRPKKNENCMQNLYGILTGHLFWRGLNGP